MPKRFEDTNKYKKSFLRSLNGAYKLLWDYICLDCNHAGIWIVDFEVAQLYLGKDMIIEKEEALQQFNKIEEKIIEIDNGKKWFIPSFVSFQYGELNPQNRVHNSVLIELKKYGLNTTPSINIKGKIRRLDKPLFSPKYGAKEKDKEKDKEKFLISLVTFFNQEYYDVFYQWLKYKRSRGESYKEGKSINLAYKKLIRLSNNDHSTALLIVEQSMENNWAGLFELKSSNKSYSNNKPVTGYREEGKTYRKADKEL
jgi:hypothetical protein